MKKSRFLMKIIALCMMVILVLGTLACSNSKSGTRYQIYYTNSSGNSLVKREYRTQQTDPKLLIEELIEQMNTRQRGKEYVVLKPEYLSIDAVDIHENMVTLTFNTSYYDMNADLEVLYRAALVQELCQVESIEQVKFMVGENDATYQDGTIIGIMTMDSFSNDSITNIGRVDWIDLNLYFANRAGDKLVKNQVSVAYSKNISLEKIIVEKLIKGPNKTGFYSTLPPDMRLLSISVSNKTCYVNLSSEFATEMVNVSVMLPVYSIVNSLCELDTVDNVKIMINGDFTKNFREVVNLDTLFQYNEQLVE